MWKRNIEGIHFYNIDPEIKKGSKLEKNVRIL